MAIDADVHRRLLQLKEELKAASLNEVVKRLLEQAQPVPASMFGADPGLRRPDPSSPDQTGD